MTIAWAEDRKDEIRRDDDRPLFIDQNGETYLNERGQAIRLRDNKVMPNIGPRTFIDPKTGGIILEPK